MTETIRTLRVNDFDKFIEDSVFATKPRGSLYRDGFKRVLDVILVLIAALPVMIVIGMLALIVAPAVLASPGSCAARTDHPRADLRTRCTL